MPSINVTFANAMSSQPAVGVPVENGTTVRQLLDTQGGVPEGCNITVNRQSAELENVLTAGDYVAITPKQIKGA